MRLPATIVFLLALATCSSTRSGKGETRPHAAPTDDSRCERVTAPVRVTLAEGATATAGDLAVTFTGSLHDSYEDGHTDLLLQLELVPAGGARQPWMPSAFAPATYHHIADHCVSIADAGSGRVVLDVARLPSQYDGACTAGCCPANDVAPGPDGAVECCFCK